MKHFSGTIRQFRPKSICDAKNNSWRS